MNDIYDKIKAIRVAKGLTQIEVAEKISMAQSNYGRLEKGLTQVTIERLEQLAEVFGISVGNILNYEGETTIDKADIVYLRNEVIRLQKKVDKLTKQLEEEEEAATDSFVRDRDEINKLKQVNKQLKVEIKNLADKVTDKERTIKLLENTINALTKSPNNKD